MAGNPGIYHMPILCFHLEALSDVWMYRADRIYGVYRVSDAYGFI